MFLDELSPVVRELSRYPIAFLGGLASGVLRLNLSEDPVRSWLDQQSSTTTIVTPSGTVTTTGSNGRSSGPQSISID